MKHNSKRLINISILFLALTIVPFFAIAQDPGDPGEDPDAPIDGGGGFLIAAGIGYGIKKVREERRKKHTAKFSEVNTDETS